VVVLSADVEAAPALELLGDDPAGVGYLLKDRVWDGDHFAEAVRRLAEGGSAFDAEVVTHMLGRHEALEGLTPREHDVLGLMAEGRSNQAIAHALVISGRAVEKHVSSIITKLDLPPAPEDHRRVLAVLAFLRAYPLADSAEPTVPGSALQPVRDERASRREPLNRRGQQSDPCPRDP